jgi:hypothetical protein
VVKTRFPIHAVLTVLLPLLLGAATAWAQPADRSRQLAAELEKGLEQAVVYVAVEYKKPSSSRRYVE